MPLSSNLIPETQMFLHELKCSKKIKELYGLKDDVVELFVNMGEVFCGAGGIIHLKGRTYRGCSYWVTGLLAIISIPPYVFHVSVFFLIIITKFI